MTTNDELRERAHEEWDAGNLKAAFDLFKLAAEQGDKAAQFSLGYFYDYGIGVEEDPIKGMFWSLKSEEEDDIGPYEDELDYLRKTVEKMKRDAEQGKDTSLLNLGYFYDVGLGVAADKEQAMFWYLKALESGNTAALVNIAILYREKGDFASAKEWFDKATASGDGDAYLQLAKLYLDGSLLDGNGEARRNLERVLEAEHVTEDSVEEAQALLDEMSRPQSAEAPKPDRDR